MNNRTSQLYQAAIDAYQVLINTAQVIIDTPTSTRSQVADARAIITQSKIVISSLQALIVPASATIYIVQMGDTIQGISQKLLGSPRRDNVAQIKSANGMVGDYLFAGQMLTLPPGVPIVVPPNTTGIPSTNMAAVTK